MHAVVDPFIQICLLRRGPQDLPTSGILLAIALTAHTVMAMLFFAIYEGVARALLSGALDTTLLAVLTGILLFIQRKSARFVQTLTAQTSRLPVAPGMRAGTMDEDSSSVRTFGMPEPGESENNETEYDPNY